MDNIQLIAMAKAKKGQLISWCTGYLDAIHYFEDIRLHNELDNTLLKELCKEDLKGIRSGTTLNRPTNIQDELVLGRIYEADENELIDLFIKKFEKAKKENGFKSQKSFAKYEYKYQKGIWKNNDITKWIPIAKQWLNLLKGIEAAKPVEVANESSEVNHPKYNPNNFSKNGYNLFIYLYENYYLDQSATKIKLINIWHYFKNELNDKTDYQLRLTKDEYLIFINDNYKVKVKNVDKTQAYENKHLPILKGHFEAFKTLNN